MTLLDISPRFRAGMPGWPGDTPFETQFTARIEPGCPVNVSQILMSSHVGSHADAPLHFRAGGDAITDLPLETFIGPCHVVDARAARGPLIEPGDVMPALPERVERVLIRQYERYPSAWDKNLKGLSPALVVALAARGAKLVGMDAASVDPAESKTLDAHHAIDRAGMVIVEGLVLDAVAPGPYELIALPLAVEGCDAAPLRAVLRTLPAPFTKAAP